MVKTRRLLLIQHDLPEDCETDYYWIVAVIVVVVAVVAVEEDYYSSYFSCSYSVDHYCYYSIPCYYCFCCRYDYYYSDCYCCEVFDIS